MTGGAGQDRFVFEPDAGGAHPSGDVDWVQWTRAEGGNGNWYALVPDSLTWEDAKVAAEALAPGAHLATLTSAEETAFAVQAFEEAAAGNAAWIGLFQPEGAAEPDADWQWVTGEPLDYTNWKEGEPNDADGQGQDFAITYLSPENGWDDYFDVQINHLLAESPNSTPDVITDFTPGEDTFDLRALPVDSFTALAGLLATDGADTILHLGDIGGRDLVLQDVNILDLSAGDFFL